MVLRSMVSNVLITGLPCRASSSYTWTLRSDTHLPGLCSRSGHRSPEQPHRKGTWYNPPQFLLRSSDNWVSACMHRSFGISFYRDFIFHSTTIAVLLACPSPDLFTAITQYSSSVFSGWSNKARQYSHKVNSLSGKVNWFRG